jgi:tetratricopeptide (TPR) repeat protein
MLRRLAFAHFDLADWLEADRLFQASLELCQDLDDRHGAAAALEGLGMVALARRRLTLAGELFARQLAICQELGEHRRVALVTINLGAVDNASGRPAVAADRLTHAITMLASLGDPDRYSAARARIELGRALTSAGPGTHAAAARELHRALRAMHDLGSPRGRAQAHHALARLAIATGEPDDARAHLDTAVELYERLGDPEAAEARQLARLVPPGDGHPDRVA